MPVYPVTDVPKFITGVNTDSYILKNSGVETVYIGQDSSLTVLNRAFSLPPGSVMQWPGKSTEIWAVTDTGLTAEIEILFNSQANYVPGPDRVTATVRQDAEVIYSGTRTINAGGMFVIPRIDTVGNYASVMISITCVTPLPNVFIPSGNNNLLVAQTWEVNTPTGWMISNREYFRCSQYGSAFTVLTVKGDGLRLLLENAYSTNIAYAITVTGYTSAIPESYSHSWSPLQMSRGFSTVTLGSLQAQGLAIKQMILPAVAGFGEGDLHINHSSGELFSPFLRLVSLQALNGLNMYIYSGVDTDNFSAWRYDEQSSPAPYVRYVTNQNGFLVREPMTLKLLWTTPAAGSIELIGNFIYKGFNAEK